MDICRNKKFIQMKKVIYGALFLAVVGIYSCEKVGVEPTTYAEEISTSKNNFKSEIDLIVQNVENSIEEKSMNSANLNSDVQKFLEAYNILFQDCEFLLDETKACPLALADGKTELESKQLLTKLAYAAYDIHEPIFGETNYSINETIDVVSSWSNFSSAEEMIESSEIYSENAKLLLNTFHSNIKKQKGVNPRLAAAFYNVAEKSNSIQESERLSLKLAFASAQANWEFEAVAPAFFADLDPCQRTTIGWFGGTVLSFFLCDGCAAGVYAGGLAMTAVNCA